MEQIVLEGRGLHSGRASRVFLARAWGPVTLQGHALDELAVVATKSATTIASKDGAVRVASVEHLFAALGGLGIRGRVSITLEGDELPLLDGGAARWASALLSLKPPTGAPAPLAVVRAAEIPVGKSLYTFHPGSGCEVSVAFDTDDPRLAREAEWRGDPQDFALRIAPARTFALARHLEELAAAGLASCAPRESVVVIGEEIHSAGSPFGADEPARHKLLDLVGDLYVYGGPPRGSVRAVRPGHTATHAAVARALELGVLTCAGCAA